MNKAALKIAARLDLPTCDTLRALVGGCNVWHPWLVEHGLVERKIVAGPGHAMVVAKPTELGRAVLDVVQGIRELAREVKPEHSFLYRKVIRNEVWMLDKLALSALPGWAWFRDNSDYCVPSDALFTMVRLAPILHLRTLWPGERESLLEIAELGGLRNRYEAYVPTHLVIGSAPTLTEMGLHVVALLRDEENARG